MSEDNYGIGDITVRIVYRNKDMSPVDVRQYSLVEYCRMLRANCLKCLEHMQNLISKYEKTDNKTKWDKSNALQYNQIRHALLNIGNSIDRLPSSLCKDGQPINNVPVAKIIADLIK